MLDEGLPILSAEHEQKRLRAVAGGGHAVGQRQGGVFPAVEPRLLKGARGRCGFRVLAGFKGAVIQKAQRAVHMCYREMKVDLQKLAHGQIFHNAVVKLLRQRAQRHVAVLPGDRLPESVAGPLGSRATAAFRPAEYEET